MKLFLQKSGFEMCRRSTRTWNNLARPIWNRKKFIGQSCRIRSWCMLCNDSWRWHH